MLIRKFVLNQTVMFAPLFVPKQIASTTARKTNQLMYQLIGASHVKYVSRFAEMSQRKMPYR